MTRLRTCVGQTIEKLTSRAFQLYTACPYRVVIYRWKVLELSFSMDKEPFAYLTYNFSRRPCHMCCWGTDSYVLMWEGLICVSEGLTHVLLLRDWLTCVVGDWPMCVADWHVLLGTDSYVLLGTDSYVLLGTDSYVLLTHMCWCWTDSHVFNSAFSCRSICYRGTDPFVTGECARKCGRWLTAQVG